MAKSKKRFYAGELDLLEQKETFNKYAAKVSAVPIEDVIDQTNLTTKQIRERYTCFEVDGVTYVYNYF